MQTKRLARAAAVGPAAVAPLGLCCCSCTAKCSRSVGCNCLHSLAALWGVAAAGGGAAAAGAATAVPVGEPGGAAASGMSGANTKPVVGGHKSSDGRSDCCSLTKQ